VPITVGHTWNLAGEMKQETYPSGRVVNFVYDGAGRASSVTGTLPGNPAVPYASNVQYAPQGAVSSITKGTAALVETTAYNSRLQPVSITAGNLVAGNLLTLGYGYVGSGNNNGNVLTQTITRLIAGTPQTWNQNYAYL
jgi:YD repeat-containing protein